MPLAVGEHTSLEELLPLARQRMPDLPNIILHIMEERVGLIVSVATEMLYDRELSCAHVHFSGVLLSLETRGLGIELEADSPFHALLKPVCFSDVRIGVKSCP